MESPVGPYSPAVVAGDLVFVSGQLGLVEGRIVPGGIGDETRQALANLAAVLAGHGATLADVVKTTVFLRHMRDLDLMNEAYTEAFGSNRPARSTVAVVELPVVALVEIDAVARVPAVGP